MFSQALTRSVQWRLVKSPRLLTIFASGALLFELSFAVAPFSGRLSPLWCAHGLAFHAGILWLQGLDFVSFWSASLLVFAFPLSSLLSADLRHAFEHEPLEDGFLCSTQRSRGHALNCPRPYSAGFSL